MRYNEYQANYFADNDINSKEALLADNTFFVFNDVMQALIENGVFGFLLLAMAMILMIAQIKKTHLAPKGKCLFVASVASLLCIFTTSLFSYPLHIFPIRFHAIVCFVLINIYPIRIKNQLVLSPLNAQVFKISLITIGILLIIHSYFLIRYKEESHQAFKLSIAGFKRKSLEKYRSLSKSYINDGNAMYSYATELYNCNQVTEACEVLTRVKKYYCTNEVYKLSGKIEYELKNYKKAEEDYKIAIYMVPNRMLSRQDLLTFYLDTGDTTKAIYWAKSIINMPVKVPSLTVVHIQQKATEILKVIE